MHTAIRLPLVGASMLTVVVAVLSFMWGTVSGVYQIFHNANHMPTFWPGLCVVVAFIVLLYIIGAIVEDV